MKRTVLVLCSVVVVGLLVTGCGGGGGGGVTPPPTTDVDRLFPLTPGTTWTMDYSETSHDYMKVTGEIVRMSVKRSRTGPFTFAIPLPKFSPGAKPKAVHTYEAIHDYTDTGTDVYTITGKMTSPFPREVSIEEDDYNGKWTETYTQKVDGEIVNQGSHSGSSEAKTRNFYTNENGEFKWWGSQEYDYVEAAWGDIEVFPEPWLMFKAGATSWTVGHIEESMDEEVSFSADIVARLAGQETVTVPAGTFKCYKVIYTLKNVQMTWPSGIQVTSWKFDMTMTVWLALDVGIVKGETKTTLNASFKEMETGATGSVSSTSTSTQLKSH